MSGSTWRRSEPVANLSLEVKTEDLVKVESAGQNEPPIEGTNGNEMCLNREVAGINVVDDRLSMGTGELVPTSASCGLVLTCIPAKRQDSDDIFDDSGTDNGVLDKANVCLNGNENDNEDNAMGQNEQERMIKELEKTQAMVRDVEADMAEWSAQRERGS